MVRTVMVVGLFERRCHYSWRRLNRSTRQWLLGTDGGFGISNFVFSFGNGIGCFGLLGFSMCHGAALRGAGAGAGFGAWCGALVRAFLSHGIFS